MFFTKFELTRNYQRLEPGELANDHLENLIELLRLLNFLVQNDAQLPQIPLLRVNQI